MTNLGKVVLGIGSAGAIGGGIGYGVYSFGNQQGQSSLKYKLSSEGFDTNVTESEWTAIEEAHSKSQNKFTIPTSVTNKKAWLKNHCNDLLEKEDTSDYSKAIQWCVKKEKIVAILKKENSKFRTLNTEASVGEPEKTLWKDKITKLKLSTNSQAKKDLEVTFSETGDDAQIKEIQEKCTKIIDKETTVEGFEKNFKLAKDWCSTTKED